MRFDFICSLFLLLALVDAKKKKATTTTTVNPDYQEANSDQGSQEFGGGDIREWNRFGEQGAGFGGHQQHGLPFKLPDFITEQSDEVKQELMQIWFNTSTSTTDKLAALDVVAANVSADFKTQFDAFIQEVQANITQHQQDVTAALTEAQQAVSQIFSIQNTQSLTFGETINQTIAIIDGLDSDLAKLVVKLVALPGHGGHGQHGGFSHGGFKGGWGAQGAGQNSWQQGGRGGGQFTFQGRNDQGGSNQAGQSRLAFSRNA